MKNIHFSYQIMAMYMVLAVPLSGQRLMSGDAKEDRISLNDLVHHERIPLREDSLYLSAKSLRQEVLQCSIYKGKDQVMAIDFMLDYGLNEMTIPLGGLEADLQTGSVFHVYFQGNYFGKGSFELHQDPDPIMPAPVAGIQANTMDVSCEKGLTSSMEFLGNVQGGTAPYQLTWLVSKGPYMADLISQPQQLVLSTHEDISRMVVEEALDYYVTLLVEDACGNSDKKVMHVTCDDIEDDGMLYFQLIDTDDTKVNLSSK